MTKKLLTLTELCKLLTATHQKAEGCKACAVIGIFRLRRHDDEGYNWSDGVAVNSGGVPLGQV